MKDVETKPQAEDMHESLEAEAKLESERERLKQLPNGLGDIVLAIEDAVNTHRESHNVSHAHVIISTGTLCSGIWNQIGGNAPDEAQIIHSLEKSTTQRTIAVAVLGRVQAGEELEASREQLLNESQALTLAILDRMNNLDGRGLIDMFVAATVAYWASLEVPQVKRHYVAESHAFGLWVKQMVAMFRMYESAKQELDNSPIGQALRRAEEAAERAASDHDDKQ